MDARFVISRTLMRLSLAYCPADVPGGSVKVRLYFSLTLAGKASSRSSVPGVFDLAVRHTRRLVDAGAHTVFSMVLTQSNSQEIEPYFDLAIETGVQEVRFIPLRQIGCGVGHADIAPDLHACFRRIVEILQRRPELSKLLHRDFFSILMTACRFSRLAATAASPDDACLSMPMAKSSRVRTIVDLSIPAAICGNARSMPSCSARRR